MKCKCGDNLLVLKTTKEGVIYVVRVCPAYDGTDEHTSEVIVGPECK